MGINQLAVAGTAFGRFVGCAAMSEPAHLADINFQDLDIQLTLDGRVLDLRKVFGLWMRTQQDLNEQVVTLTARVAELSELVAAPAATPPAAEEPATPAPHVLGTLPTVGTDEHGRYVRMDHSLYESIIQVLEGSIEEQRYADSAILEARDRLRQDINDLLGPSGRVRGILQGAINDNSPEELTRTSRLSLASVLNLLRAMEGVEEESEEP